MKYPCWLAALTFALSLISVGASADNVFILESEGLLTIPPENLEFLEGLDETTPFEKLQSAEWSPALVNNQSFVDGYWVKVRILNKRKTEAIGLNHNWNKEKKIFTSNSRGLTEYEYWKLGAQSWIGDGRILSQYRLNMPVGEITTVYNFFRSKPFDRFMSQVNGLDRMTIGLWDDIQLREFFRFAGNIAFIAISISFGLYYFFIYLVTRGNYLWLSLSLFQAAIIICFNDSNALLLNVPLLITSSEFVLVLRSLLFIFLLQFFRKSLSLRELSPRIDMVFLSGILFYLLMVVLNLYSSISFPGALYLDLIAHPPDRAGPGIVKLQYLVLPFILLLLTSAILSFLAWRRGSAYAKYLCISFMLPLMTVPIGLVTILFYGFTWFTMLIITSFGGLLFLAMFIAFGFAVAQQLNDLKSLAIQQQVRVTEAYQRFVPPQLVKDLGKKSILDVHLGDQVEVERSILFSDIRDFTTISEDMTPQQTFALINDYLGRMGPIVRNQSGYIDKFMGDGLMALFQQSASDAVTAAIKMQHDLLEYNRVAKNTGQPLIDIGVGVNTGKMMLGTLGEAGRMEGSVISDAVNLAARLEGLTKLYQTGVLISEETYLALNKETFSVRLIDQVAVKGKKKSVMVYEILDADSDEIRILKQSDLQNFDKGFKLYQTQNIKKASGLFENIVANNPDDGVANLYLDRCTKLLETGWNSEIWDGIYRPQIK